MMLCNAEIRSVVQVIVSWDCCAFRLEKSISVAILNALSEPKTTNKRTSGMLVRLLPARALLYCAPQKGKMNKFGCAVLPYAVCIACGL